MDVIKLNFSSDGDKQLINIEDISTINLTGKTIEIYMKGRSEPAKRFLCSDHDVATKSYEALINLIPHTTISTITF